MVVVHAPLNMALDDGAAATLASEGLFADDAAGLASAFERSTELWSEVEAFASTLDPTLLNERVDGEWSYLETVRHLVFGTDAWINGILLGNPANFHPLGVPPAHANGMAAGLTLDAQPTLDEVMVARNDRRAMARSAFATASDESLTSLCAKSPTGDWTVAAALQVILYEDNAHRRYATRDLDRLTG